MAGADVLLQRLVTTFRGVDATSISPGVLVGLLAGVLSAAWLGYMLWQAACGDYDPKDKELRSLPSPPGKLVWLPFFGDDTLEFMRDPANTFTNKKDRFGPIYKVTIMGTPVVVVTPQDLVKKLLAAEHDLVEVKFQKSVETLLGPYSITTGPPKDHASLRKALNPAFTARAIASYLPLIHRRARDMCERWAAAGSIKAHPELKDFTNTIILEVVVGFDGNAWRKPGEQAKYMRTWQDYSNGMFSTAINLPGFPYHKGMKARHELQSKIEASLLEARKNGGSGQQEGDEPKIVDMLLNTKGADGQLMTIEQLKDIAINTLWAGYETTTSALSFLFQNLAKRPDIVAKIREELAEVMAKHGSDITDAALKEMRYLDAVVKEQLRHRVIVGGVSRRAKKTLRLGDFCVRKGTLMVLSLDSVIKNDPRWASLPESDPLAPGKFAPERWLSPEGERTGGWMPWGGGVRTCLGFPLATAEMKVVLATAVASYEWQLEDPEEGWTPFPLPMPKKGLPIRFTRLAKP